MSKFPFEQSTVGDVVIRRFSIDVDADELVWHRDAEPRDVEVTSGSGWFFQRDGDLPVEVRPGDAFHIEAGTWHRLARKGVDDLVVVIKRLTT